MALRGLSFLGMLCCVPCLTLLTPMCGKVLTPGQSIAPPAKPSAGHAYQFPRPRQGLSGFHYQLSLRGGGSLSFQGRELGLQNKKLGFLRFALLQEVGVDHGQLTIRLPDVDKGTDHAPGTVSPPAMPELHGLLAPFPGAHALGLVCKPVSVTIEQGEQGPSATIIADSARVEADSPFIHFSGTVTLTAGDTVLTTPGLEVATKDATIRAETYTVSTPQGSSHGQGLRSDIFLGALPEAAPATTHQQTKLISN